MEYCKDKNYINDRDFAEVFVRDKVNLNKYGSQRIRYELISKGVAKEVIDDVLLPSSDDELETAMELALKDFKV